MVAVGVASGCEVPNVTSHKPLDVLLVPLSTGVLSELKMMMSFFVKSVEQLESHSCPIERRLAIFSFECVLACVAADGKIGRGMCPESVC